MRILFVVNNPRTLRSTYTTAYLAAAAQRRGHEVAFVSVDNLSHEREVTGDIVRPTVDDKATPTSLVAATRAENAVRGEGALAVFDVVL